MCSPPPLSPRRAAERSRSRSTPCCLVSKEPPKYNFWQVINSFRQSYVIGFCFGQCFVLFGDVQRNTSQAFSICEILYITNEWLCILQWLRPRFSGGLVSELITFRAWVACGLYKRNKILGSKET